MVLSQPDLIALALATFLSYHCPTHTELGAHAAQVLVGDASCGMSGPYASLSPASSTARVIIGAPRAVGML